MNDPKNHRPDDELPKREGGGDSLFESPDHLVDETVEGVREDERSGVYRIVNDEAPRPHTEDTPSKKIRALHDEFGRDWSEVKRELAHDDGSIGDQLKFLFQSRHLSDCDATRIVALLCRYVSRFEDLIAPDSDSLSPIDDLDEVDVFLARAADDASRSVKLPTENDLRNDLILALRELWQHANPSPVLADDDSASLGPDSDAEIKFNLNDPGDFDSDAEIETSHHQKRIFLDSDGEMQIPPDSEIPAAPASDDEVEVGDYEETVEDKLDAQHYELGETVDKIRGMLLFNDADFRKSLKSALNGKEAKHPKAKEVCDLFVAHLNFLAGEKTYPVASTNTLKEIGVLMTLLHYPPSSYFPIEKAKWDEIISDLDSIFSEVRAYARKGWNVGERLAAIPGGVKAFGLAAGVRLKNMPWYPKKTTAAVGKRILELNSKLGVPADELFSDHPHKTLVGGYRKRREKGAIVPAADRLGRTALGGVVGFAEAEGGFLAADAVLGHSLSGALAFGGNAITNLAAPLVPAALPLVTLAGRNYLDNKRYKLAVNTAYVTELWDLGAAVDENKTSVKDLRHKIEHHHAVHGKSLIDTVEEKELISLMAEYAHCSPAEVPYLGSEENYTKYCFVKFNATIAALAKKKSEDRPLKPRETEVVSSFHIEKEDKEDPEAADKIKKLRKLHEVSEEYGKLLAYEHARKRQAQLTGTSLASAGVLTPLLGPTPLVIAGLWEAGRRFYIGTKKPKGLEFDDHGHLRVTTAVTEHADDSRALFMGDVFRRKIAAEDLTDDHKHWMKVMKFDEHVLHDTSIATQEEMALRLQESAMKSLLGAKLPPPPAAKKEDVEKAERDFEEEKQKLVELKRKLSDLERRKNEVDSSLDEQRGIESDTSSRTDSVSKDTNAKAKRAAGRFQRQSDEILRELNEIKAEIQGEDGQESKAKKAKEKLDKIKTPPLVSVKLASSARDIFAIDYYENQETDTEKKAKEERDAKQKRLDILDVQFGFSDDSFAVLEQDEDAAQQKWESTNDDADKILFEQAQEKLKNMSHLKGHEKNVEIANLLAGSKPDKFDVEDYKRESEDAKKRWEKTKTDANKTGDPDKESEYDDAEKKYKAASRYVAMKKEVSESKDAYDKGKEARIEQLKKAFEIIREAFAEKVRKEWEHTKSHSGPKFGATFKGAAKDAALSGTKFTAAEIAKLAVKTTEPVAVVALLAAGLNLVGAGAVVSTITSIISAPVILGGAAVYGGGRYLYGRIKDAGGGVIGWFGNTLQKKVAAPKHDDKPAEKHDDKKDDHGAHPAH
ncbi:hypothetical protein EXS65_03935 [Candidatus Peribacteria bacterium]|nr:hypothetical protein [Candidatus Peribacteria bacterium]